MAGIVKDKCFQYKIKRNVSYLCICDLMKTLYSDINSINYYWYDINIILLIVKYFTIKIIYLLKRMILII